MAQTNIKASTQEHLDIDDIVDDILLLKTGGAAIVIQTTAVNFGLLSEGEQDAIIYAYAGLLNSLSFPMQIVIRSKRMDVSQYLESLLKWEQKQVNEKLRIQIRKYREFISSVIRENNVLDKRFYTVIPMYPGEVGLAGGNPFSTLGGRQAKPSYSKEYILERAKNILIPKKDHMIRQLTRLGLKATQLSTQQLIELSYDIYNPTTTGTQKLVARINDYTVPLVTSTVDVSSQPAPNPSTANQLAGQPSSQIPDDGMAPHQVLQEVYGATPIQQANKNQNNELTLNSSFSNSSQANPNSSLPKNSFTESIENSKNPFPAPPQMETPSVSQTPPQTQNWQPPIVQQQQNPNVASTQQSPDEIMKNLQRAIEQAKNNASARGNIPQSTTPTPGINANFNK